MDSWSTLLAYWSTLKLAILVQVSVEKTEKTKTILKEIATFSWKHFSIAGAAFAIFPSPISIISLTHSFQSNLSICQKYGWAHWHLLYFVTVSRINLNYFRFISIFLVGGWLLVRVFMFFFQAGKSCFINKNLFPKNDCRWAQKQKCVLLVYFVFLPCICNKLTVSAFMSFYPTDSVSQCLCFDTVPPPPLHTHISFYLAHFINATQFPNFHTKLTAPYYFITFSIFQSEG